MQGFEWGNLFVPEDSDTFLTNCMEQGTQRDGFYFRFALL